MAFFRQWALGCVGACALAVAGCQQDNEAAMRAQANLPPSGDAQAAPAPKGYEQQGGGGATTYPTNYPGMNKAKAAAPAPSKGATPAPESSGSESK